MTERNIEALLKRRIEQEIPGAKCLKFVSPGYAGVPDRLILIPGGLAVFAELKRPGETPRQRQLFIQSQFRKMGFQVCGCVDSPEKVQEVVRLCVMLAGRLRYLRAQKEKRKKAGADPEGHGWSGRATQKAGDGTHGSAVAEDEV